MVYIGMGMVYTTEPTIIHMPWNRWIKKNANPITFSTIFFFPRGNNLDTIEMRARVRERQCTSGIDTLDVSIFSMVNVRV